jgi:hypothetical protein
MVRQATLQAIFQLLRRRVTVVGGDGGVQSLSNVTVER